jgi:ferredoxin
MIPVLAVLFGWVGSRSHIFLSRVHPDVYLAELMIHHPELRQDEDNLDIQAFLKSGETFDELVERAGVIRQKYKTGGWALGAFLGAVLGIMLMNQVVFRRRDTYEPHRGNCLSCGRCIDYCPVEKVENRTSVFDGRQSAVDGHESTADGQHSKEGGWKLKVKRLKI